MKLGFGLIAASLAAAGAASAASAPGAITYAVIGEADPASKVPAINAVPGAGVSNVDLAIPLRVILHNHSYAVAVGSQNLGFAGQCTTGYSLSAKVNGVATVIASATTTAYTCGKETVWAWFFITPVIPDDAGSATLVATVTYGTTKLSRSVPLTIK